MVYPIGVLALLHFFIQTKANVGQPVFVSGLFVWLMLWRLLPMARRTALSTYFALVPVSAVLTAAIEFAWYGIATKVDPFRILNYMTAENQNAGRSGGDGAFGGTRSYSQPLLAAGCANHPVDCAIGFHHVDCLPGTAGYDDPDKFAGSYDRACQKPGT